MQHLGHEPCKVDPNLWHKASARPDDGFKCHACVLLHVDDALCMHHDATMALTQLDKCFKMKDGSIGDPDICLSSKLKPVTQDNGVECWAMSPSKHIQEAVQNAENCSGANFGGRKLSKKATAPWPTDHVAETDTSQELNVDLENYCQSQVGVLHWIVELGCVDVLAEVSSLALQMASPREGHLDACFMFLHA